MNIHQQIITNGDEKNKIMWQMHSAPHAGYNGINAIVEKISQRFYWKGLKEDVKAYVSDKIYLLDFICYLKCVA